LVVVGSKKKGMVEAAPKATWDAWSPKDEAWLPRRPSGPSIIIDVPPDIVILALRQTDEIKRLQEENASLLKEQVRLRELATDRLRFEQMVRDTGKQIEMLEGRLNRLEKENDDLKEKVKK